MDYLASAENDDPYRFDCQMADPSFAVLENGAYARKRLRGDITIGLRVQHP